MKSEVFLIKPIEAAALLSMSKTKIYEAMARGQVPSVRIAGMLRVPRAALQKLIDDQISTDERGGNER
jgi:excisionase family DNA binding protein